MTHLRPPPRTTYLLWEFSSWPNLRQKDFWGSSSTPRNSTSTTRRAGSGPLRSGAACSSAPPIEYSPNTKCLPSLQLSWKLVEIMVENTKYFAEYVHVIVVIPIRIISAVYFSLNWSIWEWERSENCQSKICLFYFLFLTISVLVFYGCELLLRNKDTDLE